MRNRLYVVAVTWLCCACAGILHPAGAAAADYKQPPGPLAVKSVLYDWKDVKRDRTVPVKIYYPDAPEGKFPVIVFSHGLGGSREGYSYLGQFWASFGYVCVHLQHVGSDNSVWQGLAPDEVMPAMRKAATLPANVLNRPLDVTFAIDQLDKLNQDDPVFKGRLDLDHLGMAGHSFGAWTTQAIVGEVFITRKGTPLSLPDPRVKAAIAMSESVPKDPKQYVPAFAKITIPMMHMTGTLDDSPIGDSKAADRRIPFDHMPTVADQYLVIFQGGDHMIFSGRPSGKSVLAGPGNRELDPTFHVLIQQSTLAFWDGYLKSDEGAKKWLRDGACKTMLGENASLEVKIAKD